MYKKKRKWVCETCRARTYYLDKNHECHACAIKREKEELENVK